MSSPPALILVVGMHRSGTSLLGSLLASIGVSTPGDLIAGDSHNPSGYYERQDVIAVQEELLIALGHWWPSAAGCDALPSNWLRHAASRKAADQLRRILAIEKQRQKGPWVIKDPRTCLLLPLWREVAAELGLPLRIVLSVRDPAEVVVSLLHRDTESTGMTTSRAQKLWWLHNRELLLNADGLPLLVIGYNTWFKTHRTHKLRLLAQFCGLMHPSPAQLSAASAQINPDYRRSQSRIRTLPQPMHPWVLRLHRRLEKLGVRNTPASQRKQLQHWLSASERALPPVPSPGPWLDREHYRQQPRPLPAWIDPWLHYKLLGWRRRRSPHPLFDANYYRHQAHLQGIATPGPPLLHFLRQGLTQGLPASAIAFPQWSSGSAERLALLQAARLEGLHPWGSAALAVCQGQEQAAIRRLQEWLQAGLTATDLAQLAAAPICQLGSTHASSRATSPCLPQRARLNCPGGDLHDWQVHAWLQHLPLPNNFVLGGEGDPVIHLLLTALPENTDSHSLIPLAGEPWVFAHDPNTIPVLQRLGIAAQPITPTATDQPWLNQPNDSEASCLQLGLPPVKALEHQAAVLCIGTAGSELEQQLGYPLWHLPGFDQIVIASPEDARLLASWLNSCQRAGLQLVRLAPTAAEASIDGWRALAPPTAPSPDWLPAQTFHPPIDTSELLAELSWRRAGAQPAQAVITPRPQHRHLWECQSQTVPEAAVCISLYNYSNHIIEALESVRQQSCQPLELVVVDDYSTDDGPERVQHWLHQHGHRFARALLVQHSSNAGLAAARNTAFTLASAPWCFVLDADNQLEQLAVAQCLALAIAAPGQIAVVHPLVELFAGDKSQGLMNNLSWQTAHFSERNVVDAMALVRRSAWEKVDGYDHIPGGWEDYDFWCKLIEAGFGGILCPQRLAKYRSHSGSMLSTQTHKRLRRISRLLQQRHPWLELHLAAGLDEGRA